MATRSSTENSKSYVPKDDTPSQVDIVCGRGRACTGRPGTQAFMEYLKTNLHRYSAESGRGRRIQVVASMVAEIRSTGARFIKYDIASGRYYEISKRAAHEKTGHALRDLLNKSPETSISPKKQPKSKESKSMLGTWCKRNRSTIFELFNNHEPIESEPSHRDETHMWTKSRDDQLAYQVDSFVSAAADGAALMEDIDMALDIVRDIVRETQTCDEPRAATPSPAMNRTAFQQIGHTCTTTPSSIGFDETVLDDSHTPKAGGGFDVAHDIDGDQFNTAYFSNPRPLHDFVAPTSYNSFDGLTHNRPDDPINDDFDNDDSTVLTFSESFLQEDARERSFARQVSCYMEELLMEERRGFFNTDFLD